MKLYFDNFDNVLLREQVLLEMARIGFTDDGYEIYVHTDDPGNIPHFHYWDRKTKGDSFHTCIKLTKPEYFHHTGKEGILNSKQRKELIKFLKEPSKVLDNLTNFETVIAMWNLNNSKNKIPLDTSMPDYTKL